MLPLLRDFFNRGAQRTDGELLGVTTNNLKLNISKTNWLVVDDCRVSIIVCMFIVRNKTKQKSISLYVFTCLANKADSDRPQRIKKF